MYRRAGAAFAALATGALVLALASPASAATATDVQANNPQVAGNASSDSTARFPTNKQNEPSIAVNPASANLIAGSNDEQKQPACGPGPQRGATTANDCSFVPGVGTSGVYTSSDAGASWTNLGLLPGYNDSGAAVAPTAGRFATSAPAATAPTPGHPVHVPRGIGHRLHPIPVLPCVGERLGQRVSDRLTSQVAGEGTSEPRLGRSHELLELAIASHALCIPCNP